MLLMGACQDSPMFMKYSSVDVQGWHSGDAVTFRLPEVEDSAQYCVKIHVRTLQNYRYDNLSLVARLKDGKKVLSVDTVNYSILDVNGDSRGIGFPYVEQEMSLPHKYTIKPKKKYKVVITHVMRLDPLDGVSEVGVTIASSDYAQRPFLGK